MGFNLAPRQPTPQEQIYQEQKRIADLDKQLNEAEAAKTKAQKSAAAAARKTQDSMRYLQNQEKEKQMVAQEKKKQEKLLAKQMNAVTSLLSSLKAQLSSDLAANQLKIKEGQEELKVKEMEILAERKQVCT